MHPGNLDGHSTFGGADIDERIVVRPRKPAGEGTRDGQTQTGHCLNELHDRGRVGILHLEQRSIPPT